HLARREIAFEREISRQPRYENKPNVVVSEKAEKDSENAAILEQRQAFEKRCICGRVHCSVRRRYCRRFPLTQKLRPRKQPNQRHESDHQKEKFPTVPGQKETANRIDQRCTEANSGEINSGDGATFCLRKRVRNRASAGRESDRLSGAGCYSQADQRNDISTKSSQRCGQRPEQKAERVGALRAKPVDDPAGRNLHERVD